MIGLRDSARASEPPVPEASVVRAHPLGVSANRAVRSLFKVSAGVYKSWLVFTGVFQHHLRLRCDLFGRLVL